MWCCLPSGTGMPSLAPRMAMAMRHSHTRLLYLNTAVLSLADSTSEFITTKRQPWGSWTGVLLMGLNWMQRQELRCPITEIDWSIPPEAVPVQRYPTITLSMKSYLLLKVSSRLLAWLAARAEHTHSAEELLTPAAGGTLPQINRFSPLSFVWSVCLTPALQPALKYLEQLCSKSTFFSGSTGSLQAGYCSLRAWLMTTWSVSLQPTAIRQSFSIAAGRTPQPQQSMCYPMMLTLPGARAMKLGLAPQAWVKPSMMSWQRAELSLEQSYCRLGYWIYLNIGFAYMKQYDQHTQDCSFCSQIRLEDQRVSVLQSQSYLQVCSSLPSSTGRAALNPQSELGVVEAGEGEEQEGVSGLLQEGDGRVLQDQRGSRQQGQRDRQ